MSALQGGAHRLSALFQQCLWAPRVEAGAGALTAVCDSQTLSHSQSVLPALTGALLAALLVPEWPCADLIKKPTHSLTCEYSLCFLFSDFDGCLFICYLKIREKALGIYEMFTTLIIFIHCVTEKLFLLSFTLFSFITV